MKIFEPKPPPTSGAMTRSLCSGRDADECRHHQAMHVRVLAGDVAGEAVAARIVDADRGPRLHGIRRQPIVDQVDPGDVGGLGERRVGGGLVAQLPIEDQVVRDLIVDQSRGTVGIGHVHHGVDLGILDLERLAGVLGLPIAVGHDDGDRVADVTHLLQREERMRTRLHRRAVLGLDQPAADQPAQAVGLDVLAGEHGQHAGHALGRGLVDAGDPGMGMRAAHEVGIGLPVLVDIVRIAASAGDEALVFPAANRDADAILSHLQSFTRPLGDDPGCLQRRPGSP